MKSKKNYNYETFYQRRRKQLRREKLGLLLDLLGDYLEGKVIKYLLLAISLFGLFKMNIPTDAKLAVIPLLGLFLFIGIMFGSEIQKKEDDERRGKDDASYSK